MDIRKLEIGDLDRLCAVEEGLFDAPVTRDWARAFLSDPGHAICAAFDEAVMVAFASGTVLRHPDKAPSLFINEVGTRDSHLRQGLGTAVSTALMDWARSQGITEIWLATETDNRPARALYRSMGGDEGVFALYAWGFRWDGE